MRKRVLVSGTVQGVYFREACQRLATEQEVSGWVRNLPDGRVEAVFEGSPAAVERLVNWSRRGPVRALVTMVAVEEEAAEGLAGFEVR